MSPAFIGVVKIIGALYDEPFVVPLKHVSEELKDLCTFFREVDNLMLSRAKALS